MAAELTKQQKKFNLQEKENPNHKFKININFKCELSDEMIQISKYFKRKF